MKLFERLGVPKRMINLRKQLKLLQLNYGSDDTDEIAKSMIATDRSILAYTYYLVDERKKAREVGKTVVSAAAEYFFGPWRRQVRCPRAEETWMRVFEDAILWGACVGQWKELSRISEFPTEECTFDLNLGRKKVDWLLDRGIASYLRGDPASQYGRLLRDLSSTPAKGFASIVGAIQAAISGDSKAYNDHLQSYLQFYKVRIFPKGEFINFVSTHGTFLVQLARRTGVAVCVPDQYVDHIISFD